MARTTDSSNPADWIFLAESDMAGVNVLIGRETAYRLCGSKLAEILEKVLKAELIRTGWFLERTHDLLKLAGELQARGSDLTERIRPVCEELAERYFADRYRASISMRRTGRRCTARPARSPTSSVP